jgi:VWFA-related protein
MRAVLIPVLSLAAMVAALSQDATAPSPDTPIIRITTNLVQIDAIVTDRNGKPVTDLQKQDFEILQDGKPRDITAFSSVIVAPAVSGRPAPRPPKKGEPLIPFAPPPTVTREQIHRTMAILVDDLRMTFEDVAYARAAVHQFVDRDLLEGDLVAVASTRGEMGMYAQFTNNRELLKAAADSIRWYPTSPNTRGGPTGLLVMAEETRALRGGTISAIRAAIQGLKAMPGRKSIVLFSDGMRRLQSENAEELEDLADQATRAAVTIYTIDARGLPTLMPKAESRTWQPSSVSDYFESQGGLALLADRTGGTFFHNDNGLREGLEQALDDQSAYYLLGYNPGPGSFDRRFHKIEVKVRRPGMNVRSRTGYLGQEDTPPRVKLEPLPRKAIHAILGTFQKTEIHARLNSLFRMTGKGPTVESSLLIDGNDLQLVKQMDGKYHGEFEVYVADFDTFGRLADHVEKRYVAALDETQLALVKKYGLSYSMSYAVKKPGPYQVRMAVRDVQTEHLGTAWQFLNVPDTTKDRLALSGLVVAEPPGRDSYPLATPLLRTFRRGHDLVWGSQVLNAKLKKGSPKLEASLRIFHDGELISEFPRELIDTKAQTSDIAAAGSIRLGENMQPGDYVLQLVVEDQNDRAKTVAQAIDIRVIE